ncbi:uncharacterized protein BX664DRAFT_334061 [Halteromyces radiatus]|uniref:uncharacterized protein n=1 Tax=Halteromyces radiatus TaxID=101107 RepID=UPI00221ED585|nr:uncharacterized protein BX664DRAFT_334061 [Halteromyces radiatus]KAI8089844.1 hypothetical protein BX664DRAFT_334061 [Halteromyces radiatus]
MTSPKKNRRFSTSESPQQRRSSQQQQQQQSAPPMVPLPPPLVPYHPHSTIPGHPHMVPVMSYPIYHPHSQPQYYISLASPPNAFTTTGQPPPSTVCGDSTSEGPTTTTTTTKTTAVSTTSPRYERILPKRPSDATPAILHSPTPSPSGPHPYGYTLQPSPLSLPHHHPSAIPIMSPSGHPSPSYVQQRHSTADQREQARKISHSAIERRRRERINDKIMQLKQIIPSCADQENLHKMSILQSAIDYIQYLKRLVDEQQHISTSSSSSSSSSNMNTTQVISSPPTPSPAQEDTSTMEPLKPIDVMKNNLPFHPSSPPLTRNPSDPSLHSLSSSSPLEKNVHMKLDNLLS